jgi:hypothetical protein
MCDYIELISDNDDDNDEHTTEQQHTKMTGSANPIPIDELLGAIFFNSGAIAAIAARAGISAGFPPLCTCVDDFLIFIEDRRFLV